MSFILQQRFFHPIQALPRVSAYFDSDPCKIPIKLYEKKTPNIYDWYDYFIVI